MKKLNSRSKVFLGLLGATALITPIVAVSAVACSSEDSGSAITIKTQPQNQVAVVGQTANMPTFSVAVNDIKDAKLTYQWYSNTTNSTDKATKIADATSNSYTVTSANISSAGTTYFYVEISGTKGTDTLKTITSSIVSLTVSAVPAIVIETQPTSQTATTNQSTGLPSFSVTVKNIDNAQLSYQWYSNTSNSTSGGTVINGATSASYTVTSTDVTTATTKYFYVKVSGTINGVALTAVDSSVASLTVSASSGGRTA